MAEDAVTGTPWLDTPLQLHAYRDDYECTLPTAAECAYQQGRWRFWYQADWHYALPTVAFFCTGIALFAAAFFGGRILPRRVKHAEASRKILAIARYLSYRTFRISRLNWNSAPLGLLLLGAAGAIYFFSMVLGPKPYYWADTTWGDSQPIATRSGWLGLACLPFVIATSAKSNLITLVTGVSHEKLQTFHRWISYAFYILGLIHTFPFIVHDIKLGVMVESWQTEVFYWTGVVAVLAQTWLTFASFGPFRNWNYEFFKFTHFLAGLIFILFLFFHCDFTLSSWDYFIATGVIFSLGWLHSQVRVFFENGVGSRAQVTITPNDFIRVSIPTRSTWTAGQHYFVRFCSLDLEPWTSHPFTACSLPVRGSLVTSKQSELVFYIRPQGGFTKRLAKRARLHPDSPVRVLLDGPYGGMHMPKLLDMDRNLVIAGGSGAGWVLPLVEFHLRRLELLSLKKSSQERGIATKTANEDLDSERLLQTYPSLRVVVATRDPTTRRWFDDTLAEIFSRSSLTEAQRRVSVQVYFTGSSVYSAASKGKKGLEYDEEKAAGAANVSVVSLSGSDTSDPTSPRDAVVQLRRECTSSSSSSSSTQEFKRRPDLVNIIAQEASALAETRSKLGIFVCGPLGMQKDVSDATAAQQLRVMKGVSKQEVYLHMEHFAWA